MGFHLWPYSNFHDLNMDWVLKKLQEVLTEIANNSADWAVVKQQMIDAINAIPGQITEDVDEKVDSMAEDGSLAGLIQPFIDEIVNPVFVNSVSDMTNINRAYVLTSNGHIYVYKDGSWTDTAVQYGISNDSYIYHGSTSTENPDLNTFTQMGTYALQSTSGEWTNAPEGVDENYIFLINVGKQVRILLYQIAITGSLNVYMRILNTSTNVAFDDWKYICNYKDVVMIDRTLAKTSYDFNDLTQPGIYTLQSTSTTEWTNAPIENYSASSVIVKVTRSLSRTLVIQEVIDSNLNMYSRILQSSNGTNFVNWHYMGFYSDVQPSIDILKGKKWVFCGDSFSAEQTYIPAIKQGMYKGKSGVYSYLIGNRTLCDVVGGFAVSGGVLAPYTGMEDDRFCMAYEYTKLPTDADIITLYFGINDAGHGVPVGEIDDNTINTFYGAYNVILNWIFTNCPNVKVGIFITNGGTEDYRNASLAIAKKWGVAYLDMNSDEHMAVANTQNPNLGSEAKQFVKTRLQVSTSNVHPNALCHKLESDFIEEWLKRL